MISIIIPVYNAESTLQRLFESIQLQSWDNFEVILVDDGSTDHSAQICQTTVKNDGRFRYFYQENAGAFNARNCGLQKVKGEFIAFLDADDVIQKNYLSELMNSCIHSNADIAICDVSILVNGVEQRRFTADQQVFNRKEALNMLLSRKHINSGPCAKLFKREIIEGFEFPELNAYEDIIYITQAFSKAEKVISTNLTCYFYFQNPNGIMANYQKEPNNDIIVASDYLLDFIKKESELSSECAYITLSHVMQYVEECKKMESLGSKLFIKDAIDLMKKYRGTIILSNSFSIKEKIVYLLLSCGWSYSHRKLTKLKE